MVKLKTITMVCGYWEGKVRYPDSKKGVIRFYLINFHPAGEPEAFISCVIKGLAKATIASPLSALRMKDSDSCKILVSQCATQRDSAPDLLFTPAFEIKKLAVTALWTNAKDIITTRDQKRDYFLALRNDALLR